MITRYLTALCLANIASSPAQAYFCDTGEGQSTYVHCVVTKTWHDGNLTPTKQSAVVSEKKVAVCDPDNADRDGMVVLGGIDDKAHFANFALMAQIESDDPVFDLALRSSTPEQDSKKRAVFSEASFPIRLQGPNSKFTGKIWLQQWKTDGNTVDGRDYLLELTCKQLN